MEDIYYSENIQQEITIDIKKYLYLFWQWAWLILLITVLAGAGAYAFSQRMTPVFEASATVLIEVPSYNTTEYSALTAAERLTRTYSEIMTNTSVMSQTISTLGLSMEPKDLEEMITVQPQANTQLINVLVESTDPQAAALIANTVVEVFSDEVYQLQSRRYGVSRANLETEMAEIDAQIQDYSDQLESAATDDERDRLETKLAEYEDIYSTMLDSFKQIRIAEAQTMSSVALIEPADIPDEPIRPRILMNTALAGMTGLLLTAGGILIIEALDDKIKTPDDVKDKLGLPVLGIIDTFSQKNGGALIAANQPRSRVTESFRTLRTNLQFALIDQELRSLLVTSSEPGEGKTTVTSNLAVVFAQSGRKTIVMDADMRHPQLHKRFDITNSIGFTSLFFNRNDPQVDQCWRETGSNENLKVLTSGKLPPNPAELLASSKMKKVLENIKNEAEILIIDSPPVLAVTDAVILAPMVDGVLIVIQPGKTKFTTAQHTIEQLKRTKANILGVVIKFMDGRGRNFARRYGYYTNSDYNYQASSE